MPNGEFDRGDQMKQTVCIFNVTKLNNKENEKSLHQSAIIISCHI